MCIYQKNVCMGHTKIGEKRLKGLTVVHILVLTKISVNNLYIKNHNAHSNAELGICEGIWYRLSTVCEMYTPTCFYTGRLV